MGGTGVEGHFQTQAYTFSCQEQHFHVIVKVVICQGILYILSGGDWGLGGGLGFKGGPGLKVIFKHRHTFSCQEQHFHVIVKVVICQGMPATDS